MFLLGYIPAQSRVYVMDKDMNVSGYSLALSMIEYQTAVLRGDMSTAEQILPTVPKEQRNKVARFLEGKGMQWHHGVDYGRLILSTDLKELAFKVTNDPDHKFDLALQLDDLDSALEIVRAVPEAEAETKWKAVGDRALAVWRFDLARECFNKAGDLNALMLLLLSTGDQAGLRQLAIQAGVPKFLFLQEVFSCIHQQRERDRITLLSQVFFSLGMPRGVWICSPKRSVYRRPRYLREHMPQGI